MSAPDKCPKCGADVWIGSTSTERTIYLCWSDEEQSSACVSMERDRLVAENAALRERVKRLEEAGEGLLELVEAEACDLHLADQIQPRADQWRKAKEAKP